MKTEKQQADVISAAKEFVQRIDEIYGLYMDATLGFQENVKRMEKGEEEVVKKGLKPEWSEDTKMFFGRGEPTDPNNVLLHTTTRGEYHQRNLTGGANHRLLAQYFVVLVNHLWENEYRPRIAEILQYSDSNELKLPVFGDLRLLRNEILKHKGVITKETIARLEVLKQIPAGQPLNLTFGNVEQVLSAAKKGVDDLVMAHAGVDPKHRTIWHVR